MNSEALPRVLGTISSAVSESLELREVFVRVAAATRDLFEFDHMGVLRIEAPDRLVEYATTEVCPGGEAEGERVVPADWFSPKMRPAPGRGFRIDDALAELDAAFPGDREILDGDVRSLVFAPYRAGEDRGGVWFTSSRPGAFRDLGREALGPIAAMLGIAVQHWRIWRAERERRRRLDSLEKILDAIAGSLDVETVLRDVSETVRPVLPHTFMALTRHDVENRRFHVVAHNGEGFEGWPTSIPLSEEELERRDLEYDLVRDIATEVADDTDRNRVLRRLGMRSMLRVPVRLSGRIHGSVVFFDERPATYADDDVEVARRVADHVTIVLSHARLAEEVRRAAEEHERAEQLAARVEMLSRELEAAGGGRRVVGVSKSWNDALKQATRVAATDTTVLLTGESGTGKEVVARLVHRGSPRADRPFVAINCAALPEQLLESELFGHEKGAFTGAHAMKAGRLEQAVGGTLFLDEVGEMSPLVQAKMLRVLQEREFQRVGGTRVLKAEVRVISATNRDLTAMVERGGFREDLFYRLAVFEVRLPSLRERPEDVLPLAEAFLEELGERVGRPAAGISRDAREWLLSYAWPGNVRELRNALERAVILCDGGLITREHLPADLARPGQVRAESERAPGSLPPGGIDLEAVDRKLVQQALERAKGNKSKAARLLGLTRAQIYTRIEKYGL